MKTETLSQQADIQLTGGRKWLAQQLERSDSLKRFSLLAVHLGGCALMLAGPLTALFAGSTAIYLYNNVDGPLDWFFVHVLAALTAFGAYLGWQLLKLRPATAEGVAVSEAEAPELYGMLDRRAGHFNARAVRYIHVTTRPVMQVEALPTLPLPFRHRYTLSTGAPLLFFLSPRQFRLALAGAVAASVAETSRLTRWMAQAGRDWPVILRTLDEQPCLLARLVQRPLQTIADAAEQLGGDLQLDWREQQGHWLQANSDEQNVIDYFANQLVAEAFMQRQYWPMILKAADRSPTPVVKAFSHLPLLLGKTLNEEHAERWLIQAQTAAGADGGDVRDLLAALRIDHLNWPGLPEENAYRTLFKSSGILKKLDRYWQNEIEPEWRERHAKFKADRARFEHLQKRAASQGLHGESALRYIKLAERFLERQEAVDACQQTVTANRNDAKICFAGGLALLRAGATNAGSGALQRAGSLEPALAKRAKALISEHRNAWLSENGATPAVRSVQKATA